MWERIYSPNSVQLVSRIVHAHTSLKDDDNKIYHGDFMITDHRKDDEDDIGKEDEDAEEEDKDRERKKEKRM